MAPKAMISCREPDVLDPWPAPPLPAKSRVRLPIDLEYKLIQKLEEASLFPALAQLIIEFLGNHLAEIITAVFMKYLEAIKNPQNEFLGFYCTPALGKHELIPKEWRLDSGGCYDMSIHQKHELLIKLSDAGFSEEIAKAVVASEDNYLARMFVALVSGYIQIKNKTPFEQAWLGFEFAPPRRTDGVGYGI